MPIWLNLRSNLTTLSVFSVLRSSLNYHPCSRPLLQKLILLFIIKLSFSPLFSLIHGYFSLTSLIFPVRPILISNSAPLASIPAMIVSPLYRPGIASPYCTGVKFGHKLGQICPKCDKTGTFSDHISVHFARRTKMY